MEKFYDPDIVSFLKKVSEFILDDYTEIDLSLIKEKKWVVVPMHGPIDDNEIKWFYESCKKRNYNHLYVKNLEDFDVSYYYKVALEIKNIEDLEFDLAHSRHLITNHDFSFLYLYTEDNVLFTGPIEIIRDFCGGDVKKAIGEYLKGTYSYLESEKDKPVGKVLLAVYDRYKPFFPRV